MAEPPGRRRLRGDGGWFIDSDGVVQGHQVGILGPERIRAQVEPLDH